MNEEEAKKFIAKEVNKLLLQWVGVVVSVLGIVTFVAFWKLSTDLSSDAHKAAVEKVQKAVEEEVSNQSKSFARITNEAEEGIKNFREKYATLFEQIGSTNTKLTQLQSTEQEIEKGFLDLTGKSKELESRIATLPQDRINSAYALVSAINGLSLDGNLSLMLSQRSLGQRSTC
jgi:hypothetical protein